MSTPLSSWPRVQSVPPNYVMPEDKRPGGDISAPICQDIPIIDLSQLVGLDRVEIVQKIVKASMDVGVFQVINHGISKELMDETMEIFKEFFNMLAEDKAMYHSNNPSKGLEIFTFSVSEIKTWAESVTHACEPNLEDNIQSWPEKPTRYREVVKAYSGEVRKLSSKILDLFCEGLGIKFGYFEGELSQRQSLMAHENPPCPEPSLVLGAGDHTDVSMLTLLQQQEIYGLQIHKDGQWLGVQPIPHAFVIFVGDQLEVISNGNFKSARHRVVTNSDVARYSVVTFISPSPESVIKPENALVSASKPQLFKSFQSKEYRDTYFANFRVPKDGRTLDAYKL